MNIHTGAELRELDPETLQLLFGKVGLFYYQIVRGIDDRQVEIASDPKSISREITLLEDCSDIMQLRILIRALARKTARRAAASGFCGLCVTLKIKYSDFQTITRSISFDTPVIDGEKIGEYAVSLLKKTSAGLRPVRLVGVGLGTLVPVDTPMLEQLQLPFKDC